MAIRRVLVLVLSVFLYPSAHAIDYCSEPSRPSCLSFGDPDEYCRSSVKRYLNELNEWAECVARAAEEEAAAVVKKWNCKAEGNSYCF